MIKHLKYLKTVTRHRWFVFIECCKLGIPWRGLVHDLSKYIPCEWFPYVEQFGGGIMSGRNKDGSYDPTKRGDRFTLAWLHHQKVNKHHWQYWVLPQDDGGFKVLDMPMKYRKEMLADWCGAGRAYTEESNPLKWYSNNRDKMMLHPDALAWFDKQIGFLTEGKENESR